MHDLLYAHWDSHMLQIILRVLQFAWSKQCYCIKWHAHWEWWEYWTFTNTAKDRSRSTNRLPLAIIAAPSRSKYSEFPPMQEATLFRNTSRRAAVSLCCWIADVKASQSCLTGHVWFSPKSKALAKLCRNGKLFALLAIVLEWPLPILQERQYKHIIEIYS